MFLFSMCFEQCMSVAVGSVWWRSHWTMKGVVSGGKPEWGETLGWEHGRMREREGM